MFKLILQKIKRKKENFVIEEEEKQPGKSEAVGDKEGRIEGDMVVMCWLFDGPGLLHLFKKRIISFPKISLEQVVPQEVNFVIWLLIVEAVKT